MFSKTENTTSQENFFSVQFQRLAKWVLYQNDELEDTPKGKVYANVGSEICVALLGKHFRLNIIDTRPHASFIG